MKIPLDAADETPEKKYNDKRSEGSGVSRLFRMVHVVSLFGIKG